tara:strand:- start:826 stop:1365 length:540 start_codon:yes stop_codon:yes gene_type:complete
MENINKEQSNITAPQSMRISVNVNGKEIDKEVNVRMLLSDFLRHELGLKGTHVGCEHGICGACTVIIDEKSARSCIMFAIQADGAKIRTIESVAETNGDLNYLQKAFQDNHALQCGYCTPGLIMNILNQFETNDSLDLSDEGIRLMISGNLCRCTGYVNIVKAVRQAAKSKGIKDKGTL